MSETDRSSARHTAVVGLQWGDEGKGKIVDYLTSQHDIVVRYNGGANAGHTVVIGKDRYALHQIPSGILSGGKTCVIANGVVIDPETLLSEMDGLRARGFEFGDNLVISNRAHVVMPYHKIHDAALEEVLTRSAGDTGQDLSIGTTKRGIGPCYGDKVQRSTAIRVADLIDINRLRAKLRVVCRLRTAELSALGVNAPPLDAEALTEEYAEYGERLKPYVQDTTYFLHEAIADDRAILFEGANACLLDIDHGTFPYVTSSHCSTLGIPSGTGVPGKYIQRVVGIMKAYSTRVGAGPFPSEQLGPVGDRIRERGREYGTTTGRPRRCGWLDLVAVRYSAMVCGVTEAACMSLDVLSGFDEVRICTGYRMKDGRTTDRFLPDADSLTEAEPVFETLPGWKEEIVGVTDRAALPANAKAYLHRIESITGMPISIVSVGPERTQTLLSTMETVDA